MTSKRVDSARAGLLGCTWLAVAICLALPAWSQNLTTGAISGTVNDVNQAVIPGATVTATSLATASKHITQSQANGSFTLPLLEPGSYVLTIEKAGFSTYKQTGITLANGQTVTVPVRLTVGAAAQTVEVTGEAQLIEPDNPDTTTVISGTNIENIPDPGNDITFVAKIAPGASIKSGSSNGISGNTTGYTMDGAMYNDPYTTEPQNGSTDLTLGANDIAEVTVNTTAYSPDQGRFSAVIVSYTTKSGSNSVHGDMDYQWNGRVLNAYDFFQKAQPGITPPKSSDVVNNYQGGIGGPVIKNKVFVYYDTEGTFITLPKTAAISFPTQAMETYEQTELGLGGYETSTAYLQNPNGSASANGASSNTSYTNSNPYKCLPATAPNISGGAQPCGSLPGVNEWPWISSFYAPALLGSNRYASQTSYVMQPAPTAGCNLLGPTQGGSATSPVADASFNPQQQTSGSSGYNQVPSDSGCMYSGTDYGTDHTWEDNGYARIDWNKSNADTIFTRFGYDRGWQASSLSPVNVLLNTNSWQPEHIGAIDWTHVFSTQLVNDSNANFDMYYAVFGHNNQAAVDGLVPGDISVAQPWGTLSAAAPTGRNIFYWNVFDNLTWTRGAHVLKFGANFLRPQSNVLLFQTRASENDGGGTGADFAEYDFGFANAATRTYPVSTEQPFRNFDLDLYAGDTWQIRRNVTLVYGLRVAHMGNQKDLQSLMGIVQPFESISHSASAPYNAIVSGGQNTWQSVSFAEWQPRLAVTWQPRNDTLVKAGWGMFYTLQLTGSAAGETLAGNPPYAPSFTAGYGTGNQGQAGGSNNCPFNVSAISTPICGVLADPGQLANGVVAVNAADALFASNYSSGAPVCTFYQATGQPVPTNAAGGQLCVPQESFTSYNPNLKFPYTDQYSLSIQQQFGRQTALTVAYIGNRTIGSSQTFDPLAFQTACKGCYAPFSYVAGASGANDNGLYLDADPRFAAFTETYYDQPIWSAFNSLQVSLLQRPMHGISFSINYTLGKTMADIPAPMLGVIPSAPGHVPSSIIDAMNGDWTWTLPFHASGEWWGRMINAWQISGVLFEEAGANIAPAAATTPASPYIQLEATANITNPSIHMPNTPSYAKGIYFQPCPANNAKCGSINTLADRVQWFYPGAYANNYDSTNKACYNPVLNQDVAFSATCAQFGYSFGIPNQCAPECELKGPGFSWQNMDFTKTVKLHENVNFRFDAQFYNVFNHANFGSASMPSVLFIPGTASTAGLNSSQYQAGAISAGTAPSTGLLGEGLGDTNPRMIAFQGKIVF